MKLSEYQNEDALDLLADIIEPVSHFFMDKKFEKLFREGNKMKMVKYCLKDKARQKDIIEILARLDNVPVKKYKINITTLPIKVLDILNDEELLSFFVSQGFGMGNVSSGSATENTEATETK